MIKYLAISTVLLILMQSAAVHALDSTAAFFTTSTRAADGDSILATEPLAPHVTLNRILDLRFAVAPKADPEAACANEHTLAGQAVARLDAFLAKPGATLFYTGERAPNGRPLVEIWVEATQESAAQDLIGAGLAVAPGTTPAWCP